MLASSLSQRRGAEVEQSFSKMGAKPIDNQRAKLSAEPTPWREQLCDGLIQASIEPCRQAMRDEGLSEDEIKRMKAEANNTSDLLFYEEPQWDFEGFRGMVLHPSCLVRRQSRIQTCGLCLGGWCVC